MVQQLFVVVTLLAKKKILLAIVSWVGRLLIYKFLFAALVDRKLWAFDFDGALLQYLRRSRGLFPFYEDPILFQQIRVELPPLVGV